ncbi:MAG: TMAO reductase system periplasmic protein TorT [Desulfobacterales bacterium]|nr:TMAO reductase system periplasmic protein TorT [Desulfobacterales bacterium]
MCHLTIIVISMALICCNLSQANELNLQRFPEKCLYVNSYYGEYDAKQKQCGFPSKSLKGPKIEKWLQPEKLKKKHQIGVLFPHFKNSYWSVVNYGIITEARKLNIGIKLLYAGGYEEIEKQKEQFNQLIEEKVDGIILASINYTALDSLIEKTVKKGIPVVEVITDVYAPAIRAKALISFYEMGYRAGEFIINNLRSEEKINVAFFPGPINSGWAPETLKGFFEILKKNPGKIKLLPPKWGDTDYDIQRELLVTALKKHPDIDYIVGNAVAADVAVDILKEMRLNRRIKIVSTYLMPTLYEKIKNGLVTASPCDLSAVQGKIAVDMIVRILNGEKPGKDFPFRAGPFIPVISNDTIGAFSYEDFFGPANFKPVFNLTPTLHKQ